MNIIVHKNSGEAVSYCNAKLGGHADKIVITYKVSGGWEDEGFSPEEIDEIRFPITKCVIPADRNGGAA
jgi:hypothetical protein